MTIDLQDLYRQVIVDHYRNPRNFGKVTNANHILEGFNPLCGDRLTLYIDRDDEKIKDIGFEGTGCAISIASASLMTEMLKKETILKAEEIFNQFHSLLTTDNPSSLEKFGKLAALAGVRAYPARIKCATLCWHTLNTLLHEETTPASPVSTE